MKFIKLESFVKDTVAYLVNANDITYVADKKDYRVVTAIVNNEMKELKVTTSLDDIYAAIEFNATGGGYYTTTTCTNQDCTCQKHLNS